MNRTLTTLGWILLVIVCGVASYGNYLKNRESPDSQAVLNGTPQTETAAPPNGVWVHLAVNAVHGPIRFNRFNRCLFDAAIHERELVGDGIFLVNIPKPSDRRTTGPSCRHLSLFKEVLADDEF